MSNSARGQGIPFNTAASDVRAHIITLLASWASLVADERAVEAPPRRVDLLAGFIRANLKWLSSHSAALDAVEEFGALTRAARRVCETQPVRTVPVGNCVRSGCPGKLRAVVQTASGIGRRPSEIRCSADEAHWWAYEEWTALEIGMQRRSAPVRTWYSVSDIGLLRDIPAGSIYRLANQHQWRRQKVSGKVYYHHADVTAALGG
ncbi:hypothetical protein ACQF36_14825 [Streptomyces sp. Marseille-Q5077]|uniref:hypothetical protein n=1 Tax=Streptomyces sp. Marseille-Q5077 TaxID=3418995 RepID=UPI003CFD7609